MRKKFYSDLVLQVAQKTLETTQYLEKYKQALTICLTNQLGLTLEEAARFLQTSQSTVARKRRYFYRELNQASSFKRNWGGRRNQYLSFKEEKSFLSKFFDKAKSGGILIISEIQTAYEQLVGRQVSSSTIYRLLHRHGWRKIAPRPLHPKADKESQETFKKTLRIS